MNNKCIYIHLCYFIGQAGGSWYGHPGANANYLCLPLDPQWNQKKNTNPSEYSGLYGAEYDAESFFVAHGEGNDVPCSVCRNNAHSTNIMIPARTECYVGWKKAYGGDLAGQQDNNAGAGEFVCVDSSPETMNGGSHAYHGKLFYPVKAECGSLECPPYENNKVVSCVVCMK